MNERLQKIMAQAGLGSRRENEKTIAAGRVKLNGRIAKLGDKADPRKDRIEIDGHPLKIKKQQPVYIALNKPKGILSSLEDELGQGRRTVRDLIEIPGHLYPVGRLDKQSMGLMLMTNDGDLAHKMTHPRYGHSKIYQVTIEGKVDPDSLNQWRNGVWLEGKKTIPAEIHVIQSTGDVTELEITMREGRKRQIRHVAAQLGYHVLQLVRIQIGPIKIGQLRPGQWRHLQGWEINSLRQIAAGKPKASSKRYAKQKRSDE